MREKSKERKLEMGTKTANKNSSKKHIKGHYKKIESMIASPIIYLMVIIILIIASNVIQKRILLLDMFIGFVMVGYTVYVVFFEIKNRKTRISDLSKAFGRAVGHSFKNMVLPVMYTTEQGKLIWENGKAEEIYAKEYLPEIWNQINKQHFKKEGMLIYVQNETYLVFATDIFLNNATGKLIIFTDKTRECKLEEILENTRTTVGIVSIDNYEETLQGIEEIDKLNTISQIDKEVTLWISKYNGMVNKIEKDKYIFAIEKQYIKELEENSFEILETVGKISNDILKVPVTLSIGVSFDEDTLYSRYKAAGTALDVALGRGGNQAVIKNNKRYDIYGEGAKALDKTSRVRARIIAQALRDLIDKSEKVYIVGHKNTDIDCIGAAVGVSKICESMGKESYIVVDAKYNNSTRNLIEKLKTDSEYDDIFVTKEDIKKHDFENCLLVIVDTHKESYLAAPDIVEEFDKKVLIDHHRRGPEFIDDAILTYHEVYASSTSELVTELLMYCDDVKLTPKEAEVIYAGIVVDTKNFSFKTGVRTFEAAAYLRKVGLDISEIKHIFQSDFKTYISKTEIVRSAEFIDGQIAISVATETNDDIAIIAAQSADELLNISGILASFVLCEIDDVVMISGRSMGDINVQAILEKLGGGGHLTFAGAQLAGISIDEAKEKLLDEINNYLGKNDKDKDDNK